MSASVMRPAYATGICATHVHAADARTNGRTDGEGGCERGNLMSGDAHARKPIRSLAAAVNCRYCDGPIYVAICSDGKWRSFECDLMPAAPEHVWAWRKRQGMQETDKAPGHRLHFCAEYHRADVSGWAS